MQVSKKKVTKSIQQKITNLFCQVLADMTKKEEIKIFIRDFLTDTERTVLKKRLAIAVYLEKGHSYQTIKKDLKVSSATISNVDKMMRKSSEGFVLAFKRLEAEEWANKVSKKVSNLFKI